MYQNKILYFVFELQGIYRMSGVKSKVESLCSKFEKDPDSVNLDDEHPNVISNVLKLYLRQVKLILLLPSMHIKISRFFSLAEIVMISSFLFSCLNHFLASSCIPISFKLQRYECTFMFSVTPITLKFM